jgi:hypothetical protein
MVFNLGFKGLKGVKQAGRRVNLPLHLKPRLKEVQSYTTTLPEFNLSEHLGNIQWVRQNDGYEASCCVGAITSVVDAFMSAGPSSKYLLVLQYTIQFCI